MQEVTYSSIYDQVRALAGVSDFTTQEQSLITTLVNRRSRFAYEASDFWPRWLVVGERRTYSANTVSQPFVIGSTYTILTVGSTPWTTIGAASNTIGVTFVATDVGSGNGTATLNSNIIPYEKAGSSTIDTYLRIHKSYQPFFQYSSVEVEYYVDSLGAHVMGDTAPASSVFVTYKKEWDGPYTTSSTNIPEEWSNYLGHAVFVDFLRLDAQNEKALVEEKVAEGILQDQLMKVDVTRSVGVLAHRISTHGSRAYRRN
tara:strand:- start:779 stop:1552 length:774 start_codon:yes stop_codon:yes gene_type:complete